MTADDLEARLDALAAARIAPLDAADHACIAALLARARTLDAPAGPRLRARAAARLDALAARIATRAALAERRGEAALHARDVRRALHAEAERRLDDAQARYTAVAADVDASLTVARAVDTLPVAAGPYNALTLAARALTEMAALHPLYLRAQLAALANLAALQQLAPPAATVSPKRGRRGS